MTEESIRSPAGDESAAAAFHLLYAAADAKAELDLQDAEIVDPQKTQQATEPPQKIGYALGQVYRLPAPPGLASQAQYTDNGSAGFDGDVGVGAGGKKR